MASDQNDYDSVFKTLKLRDTRLFIPVINDALGKDYPLDAKVRLMSSDGQLVVLSEDGEADINDKISDMLLVIDQDKYILECQSYEDGLIAIRIAEYSFITARNEAEYQYGRVYLKLPASVVIYVKGKDIPPWTEIVFQAPDGGSLAYRQRNVVLSDISREEMFEKRLLPYIPYYITRYEEQLGGKGDIDPAIEDLKYIRHHLKALLDTGEIDSNEFLELWAYMNRIIMHITDGNEMEKEVKKAMGGGVILESPAQVIRREVLAQVQEQLMAKDEEIMSQRRQLTAKDERIARLEAIIRSMGREDVI